MTGEALYTDPALVRFYDIENGWAVDGDYCLGLARQLGSVLDLGCGTGMVAARIAQEGIAATGVDPAAAMLEIARSRPGGERVNWVEGDGRTIRLGRRFDLVFLTGHAFQVFLTDADRLALLRTIAAHLAPGGRFVFDSRNPAVEEWREWVPGESLRVLDDPELGRVEAWNDVTWDAERAVAAYDTFYRLADGRELTARARIGFPDRERLAELIAEAGLAVETWLGDWHGGPWRPDAPEIIPIGRLAD